jgi:predicted nucleic acid-binding protein
VKLVVDANILVAELMRARGRALLRHEALKLYMAETPWQEARYELPKRLRYMVEQGRLEKHRGEVLLAEAFALAEAYVDIVPEEIYGALKATALSRIPRDPDDWPTVALALSLDAHIWTHDGDFLGCGVATWTTDTLLEALGRGAQL